MIKKILVALDQDSDTPVATQYAIQIARATGARLTGLAVVDTKEIEAASKGGGIGSFYYAEKLRENLTAETREKARKLIDAFESRVQKEGLSHVEVVEEGVSSQRIVEDMKYHDLLVIGMDPHFFYGHPNQHTTTLAGIFKNAIGPSLLVPKTFKPVHTVLFATDGSNNAARTLHQFVNLKPFGTDLAVYVMYVQDDKNQTAELHLQQTVSYLTAHGYGPKVVSVVDKSAEKAILEQVKLLEIDLIVSGGSAHSGVFGTKFGSTTSHLVEHSPIPLFMDHQK